MVGLLGGISVPIEALLFCQVGIYEAGNDSEEVRVLDYKGNCSGIYGNQV